MAIPTHSPHQYRASRTRSLQRLPRHQTLRATSPRLTALRARIVNQCHQCLQVHQTGMNLCRTITAATIHMPTRMACPACPACPVCLGCHHLACLPITILHTRPTLLLRLHLRERLRRLVKSPDLLLLQRHRPKRWYQYRHRHYLPHQTMTAS